MAGGEAGRVRRLPRRAAAWGRGGGRTRPDATSPAPPTPSMLSSSRFPPPPARAKPRRRGPGPASEPADHHHSKMARETRKGSVVMDGERPPWAQAAARAARCSIMPCSSASDTGRAQAACGSVRGSCAVKTLALRLRPGPGGRAPAAFSIGRLATKASEFFANAAEGWTKGGRWSPCVVQCARDPNRNFAKMHGRDGWDLITCILSENRRCSILIHSRGSVQTHRK